AARRGPARPGCRGCGWCPSRRPGPTRRSFSGTRTTTERGSVMTIEDPLKDFHGTARLFPLPNLVLFPSVIQPLHIFEPRYRQMMDDALDDDRLLALVLLRPGWEEDYHLRPAIFALACLGTISNEELLADGRYNLLLHGLRRVRVVEELSAPKLYRSARVELLDDVPASAKAECQLRKELARRVPDWFAAHA